MKTASSIRGLPNKPAIYILLSGKGQNSILYVGETDNLRRRIGQHIVKRDSSVTMEGSPVKIDPTHVEKVEWWEHSDLENPVAREAAELIAFEIFNPRVRSGANVRKDSVTMSKDAKFYGTISSLFKGLPTGRLVIMNIESVVEKLVALEERISKLEKKLDKQK